MHVNVIVLFSIFAITFDSLPYQKIMYQMVILGTYISIQKARSKNVRGIIEDSASMVIYMYMASVLFRRVNFLFFTPFGNSTCYNVYSGPNCRNKHVRKVFQQHYYILQASHDIHEC